jgi:hypothetical protein
MSKHIVLCDLDSTLSNTSKREHLAVTSANHADWVAYSKACIDDEPIAGVLAAIRGLAKIYPIYIVSGRNEEAYWETVEWLSNNGITPYGLRLRRANDIGHNGYYKVEHIQELQRRGLQPIMMFEDHEGVADMVEKMTGVPVVRVRPPYTDNVGVRFNQVEESPTEVPC